MNGNDPKETGENRNRDPAVRYPDLREDPARERSGAKKKTESYARGKKTGWKTAFSVLRVLLYAAFAVWAFLFCRRMWPMMPGLALRGHLVNYVLYLLLPAVGIDLFLMLLRRVAYGKGASRRPGVDRWALSGLILLLAFVAVVWYYLWNVVLRGIIGNRNNG